MRQDLPVETLPGASLAEAEERARFAQGVLGAGFDLRAFHEAVPGGGGPPFPALRRRVARELGGHRESDQN
ncbi:hypothetical protein [Streptomyces sp. CB01881]|uniref:hypothetical protein n=1 Tax=Streptomyces sp. CB01881 TaxID=2078691 RepID=UPI0011E011D6|nr:hypothetical protein [Streptomyces sp. CB01881]TYC70361.1 hypothetical protein EH183_31295 [Streptomyces sp. CB01881]